MKCEIDISGCETHGEIVAVIDDWIDYYNHERYQWDLAKLAPGEYYRYVVSGIYPLPFQPPKPKEFGCKDVKEKEVKRGSLEEHQ
jgi:hypothetical protein